MGSVGIVLGGRTRTGSTADRTWLHIALVLVLVITQLVFVSNSVEAAGHVTGLGNEAATKVNEVDFTTLETQEVQWVWNDATPVNEVQNISHDHSGGSFTLDYDGSGPTAAINWNDNAAAVKAALEGLVSINTVTVVENAVGDWDVEFVNPGLQDNPLMTVNTNNLTGGTTLGIVEDIKGGAGTFTLTFGGETTVSLDWDASALEVETALDNLIGIVDVSVVGSGNLGDAWQVTFSRGVPMMSATDSLFSGSTSIVENTKGMSAPIDPAGIAYLGGNFLVADSEINEEPSVYDEVNIWELSDTPTVDRTSVFDDSPIEPTGLAYNPAGNGHLYISNDISDRVYDVDLGANGLFDSFDSFTIFAAGAAGIGDPEDVAWDPVTGQVFVASGVNLGFDPRTVTPVDPGPNGRLGGGDDIVGSTMDFSSMLIDLEGLAYRAASDTLLLVDPGASELIYEMTKDGRLVRKINISFTQKPGDVVVAPASGGGGDSLYLVDRWEDNNGPEPPPRDGKWFELSVPFDNLEPFVDAGADQVVGFGDPAALVGDSYDDGQGSGYGAPPFVPDVTWSKVSGPGSVNFTAANSLSTSATFSAAGVYVLKLSSTDGDLTGEDTVQVTMSADPNNAPLANAGSDQTITLPSVANLSGAASDDGVPNPPGSLTTTWSKVSGPGTVTFGNASALSTTAAFSTSGVYVLRLTADDSSKQDTDDVTITVNPAPGVNTFIDDDGHLFEADIEWMAAQGITKGCNPPTNNRFCPDETVTRGEMAAFMVRAMGYTDNGGGDLFIDDDNSIFEDNIDKLGTAGVTRGCNPPTNNKFCPDDVVTRGQMAAFLVRALDYVDNGGGDLFIDDDNSIFENDIDKLATAGVTRGCNPPVNDRFCPDLPVTRGAMAAFLHRALG